jgi:hypothetical protein
MDEINFNPDNPTDVSSSLTLVDNITELAVTGVGGSMMFYTSVMIEHKVCTHNQFLNMEVRSGEPTSATTYNNDWGTIYNQLWALNMTIERCSEGGKEEGAWHNLGRAQLLSAYYLAILADGWGDAPWEEALQPSTYMQPNLSSQDVMYADVFAYIDAAIANFQKTDLSDMGDQDLFYGGDTDAWLKFAYALKARYLLRVSAVNPNYAGVIAAANNSFTGMADQCLFEFDGSSATAAWYRMRNDRNSHGASQSLHDKLVDRNDPRDAIYFIPNPQGDGTLVFAPNGQTQDIQSYYGVSGLSVIDAPTYIFSYHELEFIKAEAYVRLGGAANLALAKTALENAITAAFQKPNVGLTAAEAATYFTDEVSGRFDSDPLLEVVNQKYLAFFEEESLEAYSDIRRLQAMGDGSLIELVNPFNATVGFPQRFTYGSSDVTTNPNVAAAYGNGSYVYTEKVRWAGGTR